MHRSQPRRTEGSSAGSRNGQCKGPEATELCAFQRPEWPERVSKKTEGHDLS